MTDFLYPTQANEGREWFQDMLLDWQKSGKTYLCFPFFKFKPHTVPYNDDFWMFMYYRVRDTEFEHLKGVVKFRIHVTRCSDRVIDRPDVFVQTFGGNEKIWFLCDRAEELEIEGGKRLTLHDFAHRDRNKETREPLRLASAMRSSIAPVRCLRIDFRARASYP